MKVSIGAGLKDGDNPTFREDMHRLGYQLAANNVQVVLGRAPTSGLLKALAEGIAKANGNIVLILEEENPLTEVLPPYITVGASVPRDQHEKALVNAGDAFIAGYGGTGTFADLACAFTGAADASGEGKVTKPVIIYGTNNPLQELVPLIEKLSSVGLASSSSPSLIRSATIPADVLQTLGLNNPARWSSAVSGESSQTRTP